MRLSDRGTQVVARRLLVGATLAVAATLLIIGQLWAHGALKSSSPAAGAHLDRLPREIRLTFTELPERAFTRISLEVNGRAVPVGELTIAADSPRVAFVAINEDLAPGTYTVRWQFGGKDGHPVRDSFKFVVAPGAIAENSPMPTGTSADTVATGAAHHSPTSIPERSDTDAFDAGSPLFAVVRWFTFIAAFGIVGGVAFRYAVAGRMSRHGDAAGLAVIEPALSRAAAIITIAAVLLFIAGIGRLYAQSVAMHGPRDALDGGIVGSMITMTLWGRAWLLQMAAAVLAGAASLAIRRGRFGAWGAVATAAVLVAVSLALSGHAPGSPRLSALAVGSDVLHVIGAAGWLGSLFFLIAAGITAAHRLPPEVRGPAVAELVNAFSPAALVFAALAASTGVFAAWLHLQRLGELWSSDYGRTLLIKLAVLSVVGLTGAYNWLRVRPALGDDAGTRRIRRSATVEVAVAAVVLAITAVLVATATPAMP